MPLNVRTLLKNEYFLFFIFHLAIYIGIQVTNRFSLIYTTGFFKPIYYPAIPDSIITTLFLYYFIRRYIRTRKIQTLIFAIYFSLWLIIFLWGVGMLIF